MKKTIAIMQPTYLPWLGFFDLIKKADVFVFYDSAQFSKQSWQQRNRIRDRSGEIMLTVPVITKGLLGQSILDVKIDHSQKFIKKHLLSIQMNYSKSKNFDLVFPKLEEIYLKKDNFLIDLNLKFIHLGLDFLEIKTKTVFSSTLKFSDDRVQALVDICESFKATHYYSPAGAKEYIDLDNQFVRNDIKVEYQNFAHPIYAQGNFNDFISHLSFIDYLFNEEVVKYPNPLN